MTKSQVERNKQFIDRLRNLHDGPSIYYFLRDLRNNFSWRGLACEMYRENNPEKCDWGGWNIVPFYRFILYDSNRSFIRVLPPDVIFWFGWQNIPLLIDDVSYATVADDLENLLSQHAPT